MCGLAGVLLEPKERSAETWEAIRRAFIQNLLANQERGKEASGVARIQRDGSCHLYKSPLPAEQLVAQRAFQNLLAGLDANTTMLLGHTRAPTKGTPAHNGNNHPLWVGHVVGIHNGHIENDDDLFERLRFQRHWDVDSEIIFQILNHLHPDLLDDLYPYAIGHSLRLLEGKFTLMAVDLRQPYRLIVVRQANPLSFHHHAAWGAIFFSSRYLFLRQVFGRDVRTEILRDGTIYLFDGRALNVGPVQRVRIEFDRSHPHRPAALVLPDTPPPISR